MKLRPPSPALAISIIALVAACTGSAIAATVITSSQIKNGTIQGLDIKNATITASKLTQGTQNLIRKSSAGKIAYEVTRKAGPEAQPANVIVKVASLSVPAGAYTVQANTIMTALVSPANPLTSLLGADGSLGGTCTLDTGGPTHSSTGTIVVDHRQTPTTLSMQMTRTISAPTEFFVQCSATAPWRTSETSIIATAVDGISLTDAGS